MKQHYMKLKSILLSGIFILSAFSHLDAQTAVNSENFDGVVNPAMPTNWISTDVAGTTWRTDSTNSSVGYPSATGVNNMLIRNTDPSGTYVLTSPSISASGFKNISVTWATRVSTNFTSSGSTTPIFEYSLNGGSTWTALAYVENPANSVWAPENGGSDIPLPASADGALNLKFRWTINIVNNPNGTYRMDDFAVHGNLVNTVNDYVVLNKMNIYPNPSTGIMTFNLENSKGLNQITITDITGKVVANMNQVECPFQWNGDTLYPGFYLATIVNERGVRYAMKFEIQ